MNNREKETQNLQEAIQHFLQARKDLSRDESFSKDDGTDSKAQEEKSRETSFTYTIENFSTPIKVSYCTGKKAEVGPSIKKITAEVHFMRGSDFLKDPENIKRLERRDREYLEIAEASGNRRSIAHALESIGDLLMMQKQWKQARDRYEQSLKIFEDISDTIAIIVVLHQLIFISYSEGNMEEAARFCRKMLSIAEKLNWGEDKAVIYNHLAKMEQCFGNYEEAERLYRESLKIWEALDDKSWIAFSLRLLGSLAEEQGKFDMALKNYLIAALLYHKQGSLEEKEVFALVAGLEEKLGKEEFDRCMRRIEADPGLI